MSELNLIQTEESKENEQLAFTGDKAFEHGGLGCTGYAYTEEGVVLTYANGCKVTSRLNGYTQTLDKRNRLLVA